METKKDFAKEVKTETEEVKTEPAPVAEEIKPEPLREPVMVELVSMDGRDLEVAINAVVWKGKKITVPQEQEAQVRDLLSTAGFYVK